MKIKTQITKERLALILCTLLVLVINVANISKSNIIYLTTDEQGPFAVAAYLSGQDWSGTTSNIAYYSYGYSFIIWPLFMLIKDPSNLYKACILVNSIMISSIVPIAFYCIKKFSKELNIYLTLAISICVAVYSSNIVRANMALYEAPLIFITWLLFLIFVNLDDKSKLKEFAILGILLCYSYMIHQRMLGTLVAGILTILLMKIFKKINSKQILVFSASIIFMMLIHKYLKAIFKTHVWLNSIDSMNNDYVSQYHKILDVFTINGLLSTLRGLLGQLFYIGAATYLIGFIAILFLAIECYKFFINIKRGNHGQYRYSYTYIFIFFNFLFTLGIGVIFMNSPDRADHIVYGRYNEMIFGPFLLIALVYIYDVGNKLLKKFIISALSLTILGIIIDHTYGALRNASFATISCIGINQYYFHGELHIYIAVVAAIIGAIVIYISTRINIYIIKYAAIFMLSSLFIFTGYKVLKDSVFPQGDKWFRLNDFVNIVSQDNGDLPVYYLGPESKNYTASFVQFLFKDKPIKYIEDGDIPNVNEEHYLITAQRTAFNYLDRYQVMDTVNYVTLLKYNGKTQNNINNTINLTKSCFESQNQLKTDKNNIISNGKSGYLTYGPYYKLDNGSYIVKFEIELIKSSYDEIGFIDLNSNNIQLDKSEIKIGDFEKSGTIIKELKANIKEPISNFETRVYVNGGNIIRINSIRITKLD